MFKLILVLMLSSNSFEVELNNFSSMDSCISSLIKLNNDVIVNDKELLNDSDIICIVE
jgi:hypothetical protein